MTIEKMDGILKEMDKATGAGTWPQDQLQANGFSATSAMSAGHRRVPCGHPKTLWLYKTFFERLG